MKKIYFLLVFGVLFFLPLKAFAAIDVSLQDSSTSTVQSISVSVNTGTETLKKIVLAIKKSEDVEIRDVNTGTINCSTFDFTEDTEAVKITCELGEQKVLNGVLANIIFTSDSSNYYFSFIEESSDIGSLTLGEVTNVGTESDEGVGDTEEEEVVYQENDNMEITGPAEVTGLKKIEEYLPYILIAGSVVLLISIVGIILSKKKAPKDSSDSGPSDLGPTQGSETTPPFTPDSSMEATTEMVPPVAESTTSEPTLKDIVNQTTAPQPVQADISTELPAPETDPSEVISTLDAPIQTETPPLASSTSPLSEPVTTIPEVTPVTTTEEVTPPPVSMEQPVSTPNSSEDIDLKELMDKEATANQELTPPQGVPFNADLNVNTTPPVAQTGVPTENAADVMPEINEGLASPDVYLNRIQEETNNLVSQTPTGESVDNTVETASDIPQTPPNL
jgi:hypothetical protein